MEVIIIEKCPLCNSSHTYNLLVERSVVVQMVFQVSIFSKKNPYKVTRIFTCPSNGNQFQGDITLYQQTDSRIELVKVLGVKDEA